VNYPTPPLADVLVTFANHVSTLMTEKPSRTDAPYCNRARVGLCLGGWSDDAPRAWIDVEIRPSENADPENPWGVWAQVWIRTEWRDDDRHEEDRKGFQCFGNRHGGAKEYARLCAPVIAYVAAYHAGTERMRSALESIAGTNGAECAYPRGVARDALENR
jgi:hypothetical protein